MVRACDVGPRALGQEVARAPGGGFRLYDTDPGATVPRTQYLTGFRDGCARRFTAALALFGSPQVHEATRYASGNDTPYLPTDIAYEKVKNRICGVRRGEFCPETRTSRLARQATFLTAYPDFGDAGEWLEAFLFKGQLAAYQLRAK